MDKLLELINDYELDREQKIESLKIHGELPLWKRELDCDGEISYVPVWDFKWEELYGHSAVDCVISKRYGFIDWLALIEKIDYDAVHEWEDFYAYDLVIWDDADWVTALLAIAENPIKTLNTFLK